MCKEDKKNRTDSKPGGGSIILLSPVTEGTWANVGVGNDV